MIGDEHIKAFRDNISPYVSNNEFCCVIDACRTGSSKRAKKVVLTFRFDEANIDIFRFHLSLLANRK